MPTIYDNVESHLVDALVNALGSHQRADFCVGYFNLRGWGLIDKPISSWAGGDDSCIRLLVGMHRTPQEELERELYKIKDKPDNKTIAKLKRKFAEEFRRQLSLGYPSTNDQTFLRLLVERLRQKQLIVRLFTRYPLHAKLYLLHRRNDSTHPIYSFLGSSNLTMSGLKKNGELNIEVSDRDANKKLQDWFDDKWNDVPFAIDISEDLINVIDESWAGTKEYPPYHIFLKMVYHLAREARAGIKEFQLPKNLAGDLLDFQEKAVLIAARHLHKRGGVLIGDVVGLGKTIVGTALAKIFNEDFGYQTLVICPKNLVEMWQKDYLDKYSLHGRVESISTIKKTLADFSKRSLRYQIIIIDESHNLRNPQGIAYQAIKDYIAECGSKVILLSATPYNKSFFDLSAQLQLFLQDDEDLGITPEHYIRFLRSEGTTFSQEHPETFIRSIRAFEKSDYAGDWQELMRLYLVRRTRSFIKEHYARYDEQVKRKYLLFKNGERSYFPERLAKKVEFGFSDNDPEDQYAKLYSAEVVTAINRMELPRYGLKIYLHEKQPRKPTESEKTIIENLSRAGKRLMGFCRTNLFKRLESSGQSFLLSLSRHALRNAVYIYAIKNHLPLPIGQDVASFLDGYLDDQDPDDDGQQTFFTKAEEYLEQGKQIYEEYRTSGQKDKFQWIDSAFFISKLETHLAADLTEITGILKLVPTWFPDKDRKISALYDLCVNKHPHEKILIFTQYSDTAVYLAKNLKSRTLQQFDYVTGSAVSPRQFAYRFSPVSNKKRDEISVGQELRILIATDVLSEGQNLQDGHIIVNYDLPWAIIRLIQRAGRVDRIGQRAPEILCYSFLPENGIERVISLRKRLEQRIKENSEVVGSDETFFDGDPVNLQNLYTEKRGILDEEDAEDEVDIASLSYQIWKSATEADPTLAKTIPVLPNVVYSTKPADKEHAEAGGDSLVLFTRTADDNDVLTWITATGAPVTQSQHRILGAARCNARTRRLEPLEQHHDLVGAGIEFLDSKEFLVNTEGTLGRKTSIKYRVYERLEKHYRKTESTIFGAPEGLEDSINQIYRYPLQRAAHDKLQRQLKTGVTDEALTELVVMLNAKDELIVRPETDETPKGNLIICSLGIRQQE